MVPAREPTANISHFERDLEFSSNGTLVHNRNIRRIIEVAIVLEIRVNKRLVV